MNKKLANIGCRIGFITFILCMIILVAGVQWGAASERRQTVQSFSDNPVITQTNPLFMRNGTRNSELINQLVYLSQNAERSLPNLQSGHLGVSGIEVSDARHIREFNGGELPDIFLFEPHGTFSSIGTPPGGMVNDQTRDNFTHSRWRLVYITHPDDGSDPVFTFKMADAFRNNRMHSVSTDGWINNIGYENSDLRLNLIEEFDNVLDLFYNATELRSNFVAPRDLPGGWQNAQPNIGNTVNQSIVGDALDDLIWLPSAYEVAGSSGQDLWRLSREERSHEGFSSWAWLRSGHGTSPYNRVRLIEALGTAMRNDSEFPTTSQAVVPAIHLSFSNYVFVDAGFTDQSSVSAAVSIGQENPRPQSRFAIERYTGEETIIFDAGEFNTIQNLTLRYGVNEISIIPTDTQVEFNESFGTILVWYSENGRVVNLRISGASQTFRATAHATNNWEITRVYGWPTGFGLSASPQDSTIIANNSFVTAIEAPIASPNGHHFYGWWTNNGTSGNWGNLVDVNTAVANIGNLETVEQIETLYARWTQNTAAVERIHYDNSIESLGVQVVWLAGVVMEPVLSSHLPADENLVFGGWWSQNGAGGDWGQRITANTFITEAQNGTTIQIFARWQLYVPRPVLDEFNLSTRRISWESNISGASFVVSVNGEAYQEQAEDYFNFAHFTQGTHTISIRTVSAGYESDTLFVTVVIPHTPTFTEVWTGYDTNEPRPAIGDTIMDGVYEYELVRWDSV
ncbi:MAG: hypothetical protein FWD82_08325, partial [Defluviitaleaceae bacterium]|nr:hypothetical protein [Defluviitaleaceae bacterium]